MASTTPRGLVACTYEQAARDYLRSLPLEHFMEATGQSTQRKITIESLDLVAARRPDVHVFSELLVQYPVPGQRRPGQVVADNMVVITNDPIEANSSFNYPLESARPFWMLEYVSKNNKRKDYDDNFDKYERDLKVPYYLTFYPDDQELSLYRHTGKKYVSVKPNAQGRYAIPELDLEVALKDEWVRFWHQGKLLPLPAELDRELQATIRAMAEATRQLKTEAKRAAEAEGVAAAATARASAATQREKEATQRADEATRQKAELQRLLEETQRQLAAFRGDPLPPSPSNGKNGRNGGKPPPS